MQVSAGRPTARTTVRNHLSGRYCISLFHFEIRKMQVEAHQALPVIDHDKPALEVQLLRKQYSSRIDRPNWSSGWGRIVQTQMSALNLTVEDALGTEHPRNGSIDRRLEVSSPELLGYALGKNVLLYLFVGGDLLQLLGTGLGELLRNRN